MSRRIERVTSRDARATIDEFGRRLGAELGSGRRENRFLREIQDHLADAVEASVASGMTPGDAVDLALRRLGSVSDLAAAFREEIPTDPFRVGWLPSHHTGEWEKPMIKVSVLALALLTSAAALLLAVHGAVFDDGSAGWNFVKVAASLAVIGVGALTWSHRGIRSGNPHGLLLPGALLLVAVGLAGAVWTWHLARVTGDFEVWALLANLLVLTQGCLTAWLIMEFRSGQSPA